ncbi:MAG: type IV pili methyl-accepting chemotaxis transducer N-terminal domain-containing protein [Sulfuricurvum sp.]|nr:type IV pili methyl-accepting chemotaxis transducer N-terminal domain-containing protein [Sulfuricurvum sp.]
MQSISTKVRWIVAILSINLVTIIMVDIWLNMDQKYDAKVINTAGKQRMLSQRTVLQLHRLLVDEEGAYEKLQQARNEFDQNFKRLSAITTDYQGFPNAEIEATMMEVQEHWNRMAGLIDRYLVGDHNLNDLKALYDNGDSALALMDKAVMQYEANMTEKRLLAYRIQIALALISFGIILYMARTTLQIQHNLQTFMERSKSLIGKEKIVVKSNNELDIAYSHIEYFLKNVEDALQSATDAIEKSEVVTAGLYGATPEAKNLLEQSEDAMIQVGEELHQTSNRLKKLKSNLEKANAMRNPF